jgi:transcription elongation GreA/GreB family factor
MEFNIVGTEESDIKQGLLSYQAPIAKEMISLEEGEYFDYQNTEYEILKVSII